MTSNDIASKVKNEVLDTYPQDGVNIVIPAPDNYAFQLTSTSNEMRTFQANELLEDNRMSVINLNDCERLLKEQNNIPENASLIILKYEKLTGIGSEKSIQYEVYSPDYKQLDLSICNSSDIDIAIPIAIDKETENLYNDLKEEGYDLFDRNSKFYIDICTPFQAENGADVLLVDRLYYFFSKIVNITTCPSNCQYSTFSIDTKYLSCQCEVNNENIDLENSEKFLGKLIYNLTEYILKYTSYKTMKCYKLVFSYQHFIKNGGSIILLAVFIIFVISLVIFAIKGLSALKLAISKILFNQQAVDNKLNPILESKLKNKYKSTDNKNTKKYNPPKKTSLFVNNAEKGTRDSEKKLTTLDDNNINIKPSINNNIRISTFGRGSLLNTGGGSKIYNQNTLNTNDNNNNNEKHIQINAGGVKSFYLNLYSNSNLKTKKEEKEEKPERTKEIKKTKKARNNYIVEKPKKSRFKEVLESSSSMVENKEPEKEEEITLDDYELNHLGYLDALKLDKRNCCQIYCSLLKRDQNIMYTCVACNDYNLLFVKIAKLILIIATLMTMNAFLFRDKTFHKLFMSGVHYYVNYQYLQIGLSVVITYVVEVVLCYLTLTDRHIYEIKAMSKKENNGDKIFEILNCIKNKLLFFYVSTFIILLFYWYMVSAFCAVYPSTQKHYLTDCLISFLIFSIIPFFVYAIMTLLRVIALNDVNKKRLKCVYVTSQSFPIF